MSCEDMEHEDDVKPVIPLALAQAMWITEDAEDNDIGDLIPRERSPIAEGDTPTGGTSDKTNQVKTKRRSRYARITYGMRKEVCLYKKEHPNAYLPAVADYFNTKWNITIGKTTYYEIMTQADKWLSLPDDVSEVLRAKVGRRSDIEDVLFAWFQDARNQNEIITNAILHKKAKCLGRERQIKNMTFSDSWFSGFKKRHNICYEEVQGVRTLVVTAGTSLVELHKLKSEKYQVKSLRNRPSLEKHELSKEGQKGKRSKITAGMRKEVCAYKRDHPKTSLTAIVNHFNSKWDMTISSSTVWDIMDKSDKWLSISDDLANLTRVKLGRRFDIEEVIYQWFMEQRGQGMRITDAMILKQAKIIVTEKEVHDLCISDSWLGRFKHRYLITRQTINGVKTLAGKAGMNPVQLHHLNLAKNQSKIKIKRKEQIEKQQKINKNDELEQNSKDVTEMTRGGAEPQSELSTRKEICQFSLDNPSYTSAQIAKHFSVIWCLTLRKATIEVVLRHRDLWLAMSDVADGQVEDPALNFNKSCELPLGVMIKKECAVNNEADVVESYESDGDEPVSEISGISDDNDYASNIPTNAMENPPTSIPEITLIEAQEHLNKVISYVRSTPHLEKRFLNSLQELLICLFTDGSDENESHNDSGTQIIIKQEQFDPSWEMECPTQTENKASVSQFMDRENHSENGQESHDQADYEATLSEKGMHDAEANAEVEQDIDRWVDDTSANVQLQDKISDSQESSKTSTTSPTKHGRKRKRTDSGSPLKEDKKHKGTESGPKVKPERKLRNELEKGGKLVETIVEFESYKCSMCQKIFPTFIKCRNHVMRLHSNYRPFECDLCDKKYAEKADLKNHLLTHSKEKTFLCTVCGKGFKTRPHLYIHTHSTHSAKKHNCLDCGKAFYTACLLKYHVQNVHQKLRRFICSDCGKGFASKTDLKLHGRTHTGEKPYSCSVCDHKFISSTAMKTHMKKHSEVRPFPCSICDKRFKFKVILENHLRTHTRDQPFACDVCGKKFSHSGSLSNHIRLMHKQ